MENEQERRARGMQRVPVKALVEICGRDAGGAPAFEAESVDVSGRGMHLRTAYLPELGSPLVCRFESGGQEIVVEGTVAWRREQGRGGEFGIQFTALDSGSVEALKQLCGMTAPATAAGAEESQGPAGVGLRVRLHIDGLGSPMKACVKSGGRKHVQVASNLEFLKVGRHLEIEDVGAGERRGAQIDGVDVVIDPQTRVPQLVVALRYDGASDDTPEPSVIDAEGGAERATEAEPAGFSAAAASTEDAGPAHDCVDREEMDEEAAAMRGKVASMAVEAGAAVKKGGAMFAKLGGAAALGVGRFFKGAGQKVMELKRKGRESAPRRTTAAPPSGVMAQMGHKLRPQSAVAQAEPTVEPTDPGAKKRRVKRIAAVSALAALLLTVGVIAMKKPTAPPGAEASKEPAASIAVAAKPNDVTAVDEQGNPIAGRPADKTAAPATSGATADVPLFGPTPMATMEPAPLGAPGSTEPGGAEDGEGDSAEAKEKAAAAAAVEDQVFGDKDEGADERASEGKPGDAAPWGNGKLHEPIVHRLRLDKPGTRIQGAVTATGFTVMLPGVKVMEAPDGIMQRDARIARVKTRNGSSGAEISFQFKDGIPGYKVRLKKDYVEFLISSPTGKSASAPSSTGGHAKAARKSSEKKATRKTASAKKPSRGGKTTAKKKAKKPTG